MAKSSSEKQPLQTKKHLARQERERLQRRYILISAVVIAVIVFGLIAFGLINEYILIPNQAIATVNGEEISTKDFQTLTRYYRQQLVSNAINTFNFLQSFGDDPQIQSSFVNQLTQIQAQLAPAAVGQQTLDQMIEDVLIRQEAAQRGISVEDGEVDKSVEEAFGYFPAGTPTSEATFVPIPTSTLSSLQQSLIPPTATSTETTIPTPSETPTSTTGMVASPTATTLPTITPTTPPSPTPTEFTEEAFQDLYKQTVNDFEESINFGEAELRYLVESQLYREKVQDSVQEELSIEPFEEQVWARHILVADKTVADLILIRLDEGEEWCILAAELSTDTSNKDNCGDLDWFGRGNMVAEFEEAAFSLEIGEISQPVETQFGWHLIQVLGHEDRPLAEFEYQQKQQEAFDNWLSELRDSSDIVIVEDWLDRVPTDPAFPAELANFINFSQQQFQATLAAPTPESSTP